jgi:hypothetical protein
MITAKIIRGQSGDDGTTGRLFVAGVAVCETLELPDRGNARGVSCIPPGIYSVVWSRSPRLKKFTFEILNVPGRGGIRIHAGNFAGDVSKGFISHSQGCPLLGLKSGTMNGQRAVFNSRSAVDRFQSIMRGASFKLEIIGGQ